MRPILQPGRNYWRRGHVSAAGLLVDGRDYYRAFWEMARQARRYILIAGWQFDTGTVLLRGEDAPPGAGPEVTALLPFLRDLCERNRKLRVYVLAWDHSVFYSLKREFLQALLFAWNGHRQMQFRFDNCHPLGASHHQKFVVVDGVVGFVGGMDICQGTWDNRAHLANEPWRVRTDGTNSPPRHDVQAYFVGRSARRLSRVFLQRWRLAGGGRLWLRRSLHWEPQLTGGLKLAARYVAISRTRGETLLPRQTAVMEVRRLFTDAVRAAESLLYLEHQYYASQAVHEALLSRLRDARRPKLQIVLMLPQQPEDFIEEIGLGAVQARYLRELESVATANGHALGIYNTRAGGHNPQGALTFVHAKLMIVDDRFLTVGSANLSNRSMGFDGELNVAFEGRENRPLAESIRVARIDLLAEHCGLAESPERSRLSQIAGLVAFLNELTTQPGARLTPHRPVESRLSEWITNIPAHAVVVDPPRSVLAQRLYRWLAADEDGLCARCMRLLNERLFGQLPRRRRRS